ncbi:C45 family autoproteolytic acyltransferase/hydolase [Chachezhania antarctica]|uniref:C45 family autoproteolytic acyltransferase/hydolase n=1 Tax=Chachezhania antarctica TaxID=2340860 RepID=UPI000EB55952|nr:C45 family peptidase [Chachezhania antarctica]|tara:strand:+ start:562 stop:1698 length:1137 start_codon:yes stop_codon:yes gene_type:complete
MADLPFLDLSPDPAEAGREHGRVMTSAIGANLDIYLARFAYGGADRKTVLEEAERWADFIATDNADYFTEMQGVAEGAGRSVTEIAMLNARYELTYSIYAREAAVLSGTGPEQEGCTLWGLMPAMTANGTCMIGQNWDWLAGLVGNVFIKRVRRGEDRDAGKPDVLGFTEAGIVGCKIGVNSAGIGLCLSGLTTETEGGAVLRKPVHVRCAEVLEAWRFSEALRPVVQTDRVCSANFMIGHGEGEIIDIEATQKHCAYIYPEDGIVTHSNHLIAETRVASTIERIATSTLFRAQRVQRGLKRAAGNIDLDTIHDVMSDHFSAPTGVCQHPDTARAAEARNTTVSSLAIDMKNGVLWATDGPPCQAPFQRFDLFDQSEG